MRRGILTVDFNTDVHDFQFPCCLKHRAPTEAAIFCGLKSQIRFYIKLTQVLPYNAGNLRQPPPKKQLAKETRSANELNDAISNERLVPILSPD